MTTRRSGRNAKPVNYSDDKDDKDLVVAKAAVKSKAKGAGDGPTPAKKAKAEPKNKSGGGRKKKKKEVKEEEEEEEEEVVKTKIVVKGKCAVDPSCPKGETHHVYWDEEEDTVWDAMLNQTNIQNNNNKFYLMQILQSDGGNIYSVWMRWGRVGYTGQTSLTTCGSSLDRAKTVFCKKFLDKTKNDWDERNEFEKVNGKYDLVKMDYAAEPEEEEEKEDKPKVKKEKVEPLPSKLHPQVQELLGLIGDIGTMEQTVMEMEFDTKKSPLGKITSDQLKAGYTALKEISRLINEGKMSGGAITQACNDFYTRIPHEFGFKVPPLIRTLPQVKKKIELLEALGDIQVAMKILSDSKSGGVDERTNPADVFYKQLSCDMNFLDKKTDDFKLVEKYILGTHGSTHRNYSMKVIDVFECSKQLEADRFGKQGNRTLLFHGSRMSNWTGILSQGLRIAPPEAPVTGYMFGKGVYFADSSSKSANYCWPTKSADVGLLLLCEVALGKPNELKQACYTANELPKGKHSTHGMGRTVPDPAKQEKLSDGTIVPMGPMVDSKKDGLGLLYNEFIVYDLAQIKMRYLAKIKFDFAY